MEIRPFALRPDTPFVGGAIAAARRARSIVGPPSQGAGFAIGLIAAAAIVVGLAAVPLAAALLLLVVADWIATGESDRLHGFGIGALAGLAIDRGLSPVPWDVMACGSTAIVWRAALPFAALSLGLSLLPDLTRRARLAAMGIGVLSLGGAALLVSSGCLPS